MVSAELLRKYDFFGGMTDGHLEDLASIATQETHDEGAVIYRLGEPATKLYIVMTGKIVMTMDSNMGPNRPPMQVNVDFLTKGEAMGWSSVMEPYIYTLGALSMGKTQLIAFDAESLRALINDDCSLGLKVMQSVSKIIAARLNHFRILLVGERRLTALTEY